MQQQAQQRNAFPGSLSDLVASFENVKQKGEYDSRMSYDPRTYWDWEREQRHTG